MKGGEDKDDISGSWHEIYPEHLHSCLIQLRSSVYILQDPFVQFLESTKEIRNFLIFSKVNKAIFHFKISILTTNKHKQQKSPM